MLVVAVPEGLPLAVTISLAYSVKVDPPIQSIEWLLFLVLLLVSCCAQTKLV